MRARRILAVVLLAAFAAPAQAAYPEKPIRFVVPSAPGGSVDVLMRILTQQLASQMGQPFVVENKPGGSFVPGTMDIVKAAPDGYTLGYGNIVSLAVNRTLLPALPYDVERDLTLVSNCVQVFNMLAVNNGLPVRTVAELIDYAKQNPGKLSNGSSGNGTTGHLGGELFKAMTGTEMVHVPYKGSAQAINDLVSGNIEVMFDNVPSIGPHVKSGRVRGLGVSAPKRAAQFPDVPTIAEAGVPGYETNSWGGVIGPARLSREVISRLHAEIRKALAAPAVAERYRQLDAEPDGAGPEAFLDREIKGERRDRDRRLGQDRRARLHRRAHARRPADALGARHGAEGEPGRHHGGGGELRRVARAGAARHAAAGDAAPRPDGQRRDVVSFQVVQGICRGAAGAAAGHQLRAARRPHHAAPADDGRCREARISS